MLDNQRIQVDVRNMPEGVKPALIEKAKAAGVSLTDYIRTILCERALKDAALGARSTMDRLEAEADADYVPLV